MTDMTESKDADEFGTPQSSEFTVRDEANTIVAMAFRNGPLEDLHAGKASELLSDPSLSRITDNEMKELMINACDMVERLVRQKQDNPQDYDRTMRSYNRQYCWSWKR